MKREFEKILAELKDLHNEVSDLKKLIKVQNDQIEELKKQLACVSTVTIEENGKQSTENFGNLILDEIVTIKKNLEGFSAEGLRGVVNDVAALKNKLEGEIGSGNQFSLSELKNELLKLADMMSI